MAKIAPPTEKKTPVKRTVKKASEMKSNKATGQTPPDAIIPLQIKIPETVKNEFKAMASIRGQSMNALFLEMFEEHKESH
jgi:hypothetical protein